MLIKKDNNYSLSYTTDTTAACAHSRGTYHKADRALELAHQQL